MLCGIGIGGRWLEVKMFMNDYPDEPFYNGIAVHVRTWCQSSTWWTMNTLALTSTTMWTQWKELYLPWNLAGLKHDYDNWSWHIQAMPPIPIYKPWESYKKMKMVLTGGKNYSAKPNEPKLVPNSYLNKILKLWTLKQYRSWL